MQRVEHRLGHARESNVDRALLAGSLPVAMAGVVNVKATPMVATPSNVLDGVDQHPPDYVTIGTQSFFSRMSSSYRDALASISKRTGSPLPSLIVSFAVLHELTAIVPLVGIFYAARGLHVGERVVNQFTPDAGQPTGWVAGQLSQWVDEGEKWAHRVGRRYGVFGFEKGVPADPDDRRLSGKLAGDVANAVLAYGATKVRYAAPPLRFWPDSDMNVRHSYHSALAYRSISPLPFREE